MESDRCSCCNTTGCRCAFVLDMLQMFVVCTVHNKTLPDVVVTIPRHSIVMRKV